MAGLRSKSFLIPSYAFSQSPCIPIFPSTPTQGEPDVFCLSNEEASTTGAGPWNISIRPSPRYDNNLAGQHTRLTTAQTAGAAQIKGAATG